MTAFGRAPEWKIYLLTCRYLVRWAAALHTHFKCSGTRSRNLKEFFPLMNYIKKNPTSFRIKCHNTRPVRAKLAGIKIKERK